MPTHRCARVRLNSAFTFLSPLLSLFFFLLIVILPPILPPVSLFFFNPFFFTNMTPFFCPPSLLLLPPRHLPLLPLFSFPGLNKAGCSETDEYNFCHKNYCNASVGESHRAPIFAACVLGIGWTDVPHAPCRRPAEKVTPIPDPL